MDIQNGFSIIQSHSYRFHLQSQKQYDRCNFTIVLSKLKHTSTQQHNIQQQPINIATMKWTIETIQKNTVKSNIFQPNRTRKNIANTFIKIQRNILHLQLLSTTNLLPTASSICFLNLIYFFIQVGLLIKTKNPCNRNFRKKMRVEALISS